MGAMRAHTWLRRPEVTKTSLWPIARPAYELSRSISPLIEKMRALLNERSRVLKHEGRRVMVQQRATVGAAVQQAEDILVDGVVYQGTDRWAVRWAQMRELTTARQAAEQDFARSVSALRKGSAPPIEARECAVELREELARLDTAQRR